MLVYWLSRGICACLAFNAVPLWLHPSLQASKHHTAYHAPSRSFSVSSQCCEHTVASSVAVRALSGTWGHYFPVILLDTTPGFTLWMEGCDSQPCVLKNGELLKITNTWL